MRRVALALALLVLLGLSVPAAAGLTRQQIAEVGVQPPPGATLPLGTSWTDADGRATTLRAAAAGHPVVALFVDYTCQALCGIAAHLAAAGLDATGLPPGRAFDLLLLGIDPKDGPAEAAKMRAAVLDEHPALQGAVRALSGSDATVAEATRAMGYRYAYDADTDQFAHPSAGFVLTADGRLVRTLSGIGLTGDDLRLALVEAGQGRVGTLVDQIRLLCYAYDPATGIYTPLVDRALTIGGILGLLALGGGILLLVHHTARVKRA